MNQETQRKHRRNAAQIQELLNRFRQSQLSRTEFVRGEGICLATLGRYIRGEADRGMEASGRFIEVEHSGAMQVEGRRDSYRVCFKEGASVEIPAGFSPGELASLLKVITAIGAR